MDSQTPTKINVYDLSDKKLIKYLDTDGKIREFLQKQLVERESEKYYFGVNKESYTLDDIVNLNSDDLDNLINKYDVFSQLDDIDNKTLCIYKLNKHKLFKFEGQYINYIFIDEMIKSSNYLEDNETYNFDFDHLYCMYSRIFLYKDKPIKYVMIYTGYDDNLMDEKVLSKDQIDEIKNDNDIISITSVYIKDKNIYESIPKKIASEGVLYKVSSFDDCFQKAINLMKYNYCSDFIKSNVERISYSELDSILILKYECECG